MARPMHCQPGLFDPAPAPPIPLPRPLQANAVRLLGVLLGEAVASPLLVTSRTVADREVASDDQDHA